MKLNVGDYVRTKYGISQYKEYESTMGYIICIPVKNGTEGIFANIEDIIGQPSPNIIDLIEVGDYVNGKLVNKVGYNFQADYVLTILEKDGDYSFIYDYQIKSIVTKEQFSEMEYKVNEN